MAGLPRDLVPQLQEPVGHPAHDAFAGASSAMQVNLHTSSEIEAPQHWGGNLLDKLDTGH